MKSLPGMQPLPPFLEEGILENKKSLLVYQSLLYMSFLPRGRGPLGNEVPKHNYPLKVLRDLSMNAFTVLRGLVFCF